MRFLSQKFQSKGTDFEKSASFSVILHNTPEDWDKEILDILYKQQPWLQDFELRVEFLKKLPDRRYGIGSVQIIPRQVLDAVGSATAERKPTELAQPVAVIPVIIKEGELAPLDLFVMGGKVYPLSEEIFKRKLAGLTTSTDLTPGFGDQTIIGYLWPAARAMYAEPLGTLGLNLLTKAASYENRYKAALAYNRLIEKVASELAEEVQEGVGYPILSLIMAGELKVNEEKLACLMDGLSPYDPLEAPLLDILRALAQRIPEYASKGSVVQILPAGTDGRVFVRTTDPDSFSFDRGYNRVVDVGVRSLPITVSKVERKVLIIPKEQELDPDETELPEDGCYTCTIHSGPTAVVGRLYANICDFDGERLPLRIFSDAMSRTWGRPVRVRIISLRPLRNMPSGQMVPGTTGAFDMGGGTLSVPITVRGFDRDAGVYKVAVHDSKMLGASLLGDREIKLAKTAAVSEAVYDKHRELLFIPADWKWVPLGEKTAEFRSPVANYEGVVTLTKLASDQYLLEGNAVSSVVKGPLNRHDTEFVLAALGVPSERIDDVIDYAEQGVKLANCNILRSGADRRVSLVDHIDFELVKAAASIDDPNSVDAVLGLQIAEIEPDESLFSIAAKLEDAQQKVAKLLLLSRLGYATIPEGAAKVVMTKLTPIIDATRLLGLEEAMKS